MRWQGEPGGEGSDAGLLASDSTPLGLSSLTCTAG